MIDKITLRGLKAALERFDEDGIFAATKHWSIAKGGYDMWWQLYYNENGSFVVGIPIVECINGELQDCGQLSDTDFRRVTKVICSIYRGLKIAQGE